MNKSNSNIDRESFIKILSTMTPEEVNKLIEQKGKKPKPIPMVIFY
jgi:hypothetical protein